ncbi:MAG: bis(5'-nucleosyl)-tetraphosphatase (symmetrical) YqeK [Desulfitobacteriaceae bacterium]
MHKSLVKICKGFSFSGDVATDAIGLLIHHGREGVAKHVLTVANEAQRIASKINIDKEVARCAGYLHDISQVLPRSDMESAAIELEIDMLPEEKLAPYLIHGKLSAALANKIFAITDQSIIEAISCHTTLRVNASLLDKVLFIADKMSWDLEHAPFRPQLTMALEESIDEAVGCFLTWTWNQRENLDVIHPWLQQACAEYERKGFCKM